MTIYVSGFETAARGDGKVTVNTTFYDNGNCYDLEAFLSDKNITIESKVAGSAISFAVPKSEIPALSDAFKEHGLQMIGRTQAKHKGKTVEGGCPFRALTRALNA